MTCIVNRAAFAEATATAARIAALRSTIPIGQSAKLHASEGKLTISATDFDHWLDLSIECEGDLEPICVHAGHLSDAAGTLAAETFGLKIEESSLKIAGGRGRRSLPTISAADFPERKFEAETKVTLASSGFRDALAFALPHAASPADVTMNGVAGLHLFTVDGKLKAMGTDKLTLALIDIAESSQPIAVTITPKLAEFAARLTDDEIILGISERTAEVRWKSGRILGPLITGSADPVRMMNHILNTPWNGVASMEAKTLLQALRAVQGLGEDDLLSRSHRVKMTLNGTGTLSTSSRDGSATEEFEADFDGTDEFNIGFASIRMERVLRGFGDQVVTVGLLDAATPMKFEAAGKTDRLALLFPMRI